MARVCPYKKKITTKIDYGISDKNPQKIVHQEEFCICDEGACTAWDCGVCTLIENGRGLYDR